MQSTHMIDVPVKEENILPDFNNGNSNEINKNISFTITKENKKLLIYNAVRVVKILNENKKILLIKTAAQSNEPTIFDIKKLKRGKYFIQANEKQFAFQKK